MKSGTSVTLADSIPKPVSEKANSDYPKRDRADGKSHIERVLRTAVEIGKREGADLEIIELSAILHDIFANEEKRSNVEGFRHEIEASKEAKNILKNLGFTDRTVDAVCHCIESHRKRTGRVQPQTVEAKCLFDADKLDCIGAIGIVRSAFMSLEQGQEFYKQEDIETYKRRNIRPDGTVIDFAQHSSNLEYELSLKEVAKRMYTETGKRLARKERSSWTNSTAGLERN